MRNPGRRSDSLFAVLAILMVVGSSARGRSDPPSEVQRRSDERSHSIVPNRPIVAEVLIEGNHFVPTEQIRNQIKTGIGDEFDEEIMREDVRRLMATKLFLTIEGGTKSAPDGRVIAFFVVRDYSIPVRRVTYQGAKHYSDDDLNGMHGIRPGILPRTRKPRNLSSVASIAMAVSSQTAR
jgi:hypothetical protein